MKVLAAEKIWTDDELMSLEPRDRKHELWFGKIITMPPAGAQHGEIIVRLMTALANHVYEQKLGHVYDGQTGFRLALECCFEPDISFVSKERIKLILPAKDKLFHGAPDLAIEVLSPSDSITKTEEKINLYLTHGTRLAWMIDPKHKSVRVYRKTGEFEAVPTGRFLNGNSVLPGFRYAVARLFED